MRILARFRKHRPISSYDKIGGHEAIEAAGDEHGRYH
jgi:hypothetical protein